MTRDDWFAVAPMGIWIGMVLLIAFVLPNESKPLRVVLVSPEPVEGLNCSTSTGTRYYVSFKARPYRAPQRGINR